MPVSVNIKAKLFIAVISFVKNSSSIEKDTSSFLIIHCRQARMALMASKSHLKSWGRLSSKQYARVGDRKLVIKCKSQVNYHGTSNYASVTFINFKSFFALISETKAPSIILVLKLIYLMVDFTMMLWKVRRTTNYMSKCWQMKQGTISDPPLTLQL